MVFSRPAAFLADGVTFLQEAQSSILKTAQPLQIFSDQIIAKIRFVIVYTASAFHPSKQDTVENTRGNTLHMQKDDPLRNH